MTASRDEVASFADRIASLTAAGELHSERAVQLRVVEPLLELLGWDVRGPDVQPEATVDDRRLDYALRVEGLPAVGVATTAPDAGELSEAVADLRGLLADGHLDAGIATDGRAFRLLARQGSEVRAHDLEAADLADQVDAFGRFHRSTIEDRVDDRRADRAAAADRLSEHRDEAITAVADALEAYTGAVAEDAVRTASVQTVDWLVAELHPDRDGAGSAADTDVAPGREDTGPAKAADDESAVGRDGAAGLSDEADGAGASVDVDDGSESGEAPTAVQTDADQEPGASQDATGNAESTGSESPAIATDENADTEFVARFFGGGSSVGAVGTASPAGTLAGAVRYLLENHDLDRTIRLPWSVEGERILADDATGDGWTTLGDDENGVAVREVSEPDLATAAIEGLAESAGLRVMFQGDW